MEGKKENLTEHYYSQFTFKPEVSKGTQEMAIKTPLNELVDNERRKLVMEAAQRAVEEAERSECTFKPKINRKKIPNRPHQVRTIPVWVGGPTCRWMGARLGFEGGLER